MFRCRLYFRSGAPQTVRVKHFGFVLGILLAGLAVFPARAFTSFYIFGDSISATTNGGSPSQYFYGTRFSNGRVWVEVLAQRQGLTFITNHDNAFFGNYSSNVLKTVTNFSAPGDVSTALFAVWVNNADMYDAANNDGTNMSLWTAAINLSQTNHFKIITNLCGKGARWFILPNIVDLSAIPAFDLDSRTNFIHQRCLDYNVAFSNTLVQAKAACPAATFYAPDMFSLLTNILAHPASYGVTNALFQGKSIDAVEDLGTAATNLNGAGAIYIFWDFTDPTAKVHEIIADNVQQLISPVQISWITPVTGSNRIDLANVPVGLNGVVEGSTNITSPNWITRQTITSTNGSQAVYVPTSGSQQFYRLHFPLAWSWP